MIETTTETGNGKISAKTSIFPFSVVGRYRSFQGSLELAVVKKQIVVGISILSAIVPEIKLFPVLSATMPFPVISRYCSHPNTLF